MIQKKIGMLGSFSVGKTSLVKRYVDSIFSDKYHTTLGVKIDKKQVTRPGGDLTLLLWDIAGEDAVFKIRPTHLRGMAGAIIVIDGTRLQSFDVAMTLYRTVRTQPDGDRINVIFAINKADLKTQWVLSHEQTRLLQETGCAIVETSAKNNSGIDELFNALADQLLAAPAAITPK